MIFTPLFVRFLISKYLHGFLKALHTYIFRENGIFQIQESPLSKPFFVLHIKYPKNCYEGPHNLNL